MHGLDRQPTATPMGTDEIHTADSIVVTTTLGNPALFTCYVDEHIFCIYVYYLSDLFAIQKKEFEQFKMVAIIYDCAI